MTDVVDTVALDRAADELAAVYPILAKNFLEISGSHVLFSTLKPVYLEKLQELMPETDRQFWNCSCCGYVFSKVMNTVYFDIAEDAFESAYLPLGLIEALEVSDIWKDYFRELRKLILSSPAGGLYHAAAVEAVNSDNKRFKRLAKEEDMSAVRATFGNHESGGFHHFFAEYLTINPTTALGLTWKQTIDSIETMAGGRNLEMLAREARVFGELVEVSKDGKFLKQMTGIAAMLDCMHKYTKPGYHMNPYTKMMATCAVDQDVARGWGIMSHFNGSALGTAFKQGLDTGDWEAARMTFLSMLDPIKYRSKDLSKVTVDQLQSARSVLEEQGVVSALVRRYATQDDLDGPQVIWKRPALVKPTVDKTDPFALSLAKLNSEDHPVVSASEIKEISWATFVDNVLADHTDVEIHIAGLGAYFYFTVPVDPEAKPILAWDTLEARVPWCTQVSQQNTLPQQHGLREGHWYPLERVVRATMGDYSFVTVTSALEEQNPGGVSFGQVLRQDLYAHRAAIDHALMSVGVQSVKGPAIGIRQGSAGCRRLRVRAVRNGVKKEFIVISLA